jgi:zinc/manganese transport system ATP-binding protein
MKADTMRLLECDNLTLGYDRHPAVHHISGQIMRGEMLAICGPNGAGKSTLLRAMAGLHEVLGGTLRWYEPQARQHGYLPQLTEIDRSFPISVFDMVVMGGMRQCGLFSGIDHDVMARARAALARVGLQGLEERMIGTLSGGQMQRMLFARLIVQDATLILLDEPFTALDHATLSDLMAIIGEWHQQGRTIIAVLHDFDLVRRFFPRTLLLARETIFWGATAQALTPAHIAQAQAMVTAFDHNAAICERVA